MMSVEKVKSIAKNIRKSKKVLERTSLLEGGTYRQVGLVVGDELTQDAYSDDAICDGLKVIWGGDHVRYYAKN